MIARHGIAADRRLGQNFLLDLNLTGRIARAAGTLDGITVVEIGPGPGGLTRALLSAGATRLIVIERDERCLAALAEIGEAFPGRLQIVAGDAMAIDPVEISAGPRKIVANLPYNIATPLLMRWLDRVDCYESLTLMFQREVAERLVASPRSKTYGRLSIVTQWLTEARLLFDIPARAFVPPPKIVSSVVRLLPRNMPRTPAIKPDLERVTAAAFGQRRKMLRASLKSLGVPVEALLDTAGILETRRAEELTVDEFCALARSYAALAAAARHGGKAASSAGPHTIDEIGEAEKAPSA